MTFKSIKPHRLASMTPDEYRTWRRHWSVATAFGRLSADVARKFHALKMDIMFGKAP